MTTRRSLRRGQIVLVTFPFTDLFATKLRPALIVGRVFGDDLMLAFISSQASGPLTPSACLLSPADSDFSDTGLRAPSLVRLDKLTTLHRRLVRRRLGGISASMQARIDDSLRYVLDL